MVNKARLSSLLCSIAFSVTQTFRPSLLFGQNAGPGKAQTSATPETTPTEDGVRFTPGVARGMAHEFTTSLLIRRYQMDQDKQEQATERVARRLMETAHELDGPLQALVERWLEAHFEALARGEVSRFDFPAALNKMPPSFRTEFAEQLLPMLPAIRELAVNVVNDVRPLLPLRQQLKMAGDVMAFDMTFDAVQDIMQKWSRGEALQESDPLRPVRRGVARSAHGESETLKTSRTIARRFAEQGLSSKWAKYVQQAKAFYQFDEPQSATADSVLRELVERASGAQNEDDWRSNFYCNRLWYWSLLLSDNVPDHWTVIRLLIEEQHDELMEPLDALDRELKERIDRIPTVSQRKSADATVRDWLRKDGAGGEW
jgi:hypothetical protein